MTPAEMEATFWEKAGLSSTFGRQPGFGGGVDTKRLIWQGCCEFAKRVRLLTLRKLGTISLTNGRELYPLPDDFLCYIGVKEPPSVSGRPLNPMLQGEVERIKDDRCQSWIGCHVSGWYEAGTADSGDYLGKREIGVWPIPTSALTLKLPYLRKPMRLDHSGLSAISYPDIPEHYHESPIHWALNTFFLNQPEVPRSVDPQKYMDRFSADIELLRAELVEENQSANRVSTPNLIAPALQRMWPI